MVGRAQGESTSNAWRVTFETINTEHATHVIGRFWVKFSLSSPPLYSLVLPNA